MRAIIVILSILMTSFSAISQTKLDEKRGFKDVKIGDNISKWKNSLSEKQISGNESRYLFTNSCCTKVFDYDIDSIYLVFEDDILKTITIYTDWFKDSGTWRSDEFMNIKNNLEIIFGTATGYTAPEKNENNIIWYWDAKNIYLQSEYDWRGSLSPNRVIIDIADKKYIEKFIHSGF